MSVPLRVETDFTDFTGMVRITAQPVAGIFMEKLEFRFNRSDDCACKVDIFVPYSYVGMGALSKKNWTASEGVRGYTFSVYTLSFPDGTEDEKITNLRQEFTEKEWGEIVRFLREGESNFMECPGDRNVKGFLEWGRDRMKKLCG